MQVKKIFFLLKKYYLTIMHYHSCISGEWQNDEEALKGWGLRNVSSSLALFFLSFTTSSEEIQCGTLPLMWKLWRVQNWGTRNVSSSLLIQRPVVQLRKHNVVHCHWWGSFEQLRIEECFFFSDSALLVLYNVQWGKRNAVHCHRWGSFEELRIEERFFFSDSAHLVLY